MVSEEAKNEIKVFVKMENEVIKNYQNFRDIAKALRGKFIAVEAVIRKQEKAYINNLMVQLRKCNIANESSQMLVVLRK